jgi:uncharacterized protein (UPF0332 family)
MVITPEQEALAKHRFERAEETLDEAINELSRCNFRLTVNRSYYSVFYAMRAFLAIIGKDSSKHSGVISLFNQYLIKPGTVSEINFKAIQSLMDLRHEGDYQDFAEITKEEAEGAIETAKLAINALKDVMKRLIMKQ